jgi:hypothetical protein
MHKFAIKYANNVHVICNNILKYAQNMQEICKKYAKYMKK